MYPNPQDVLPVPPQPDPEQYRKRAKDLVKACRSGDTAAIRDWTARWIANLLKHQSEQPSPRAREVDHQVEQLSDFARDTLARTECALASAQFVIARAHGFVSWQQFMHHLEGIAGSKSQISEFEQAADAIIKGDQATLRRLLRQDPELVDARSSREHRATLLHYVSANGVENYRQKTPPNIVDVARVLLDAGADVHAEADVYGGGATTLELVVTSAHPRGAGVQIELAELLIQRGARVEPGIVRSCLANGCPEAAQHMALRGVHLDLEEAAGVGQIDVVQQHLEAGGEATSDKQVTAALLMAASYDQRDVVGYLLDRGVDPGARLSGKGEGQTALHIAAYQAHVHLADLLVRRGAPINVTDDTYGTPPLVWALHAWLVEERSNDADYKAVIRMLVDAGARVRPEWIEDDRVRDDVELFAMLSRRSVEP